MSAGVVTVAEHGGRSASLATTGRIVLGEDGLRCEGIPALDEFARIGTMLHQAHRMLAWWIGDWYNAGEAMHGETFAQLLDATGLDPSTVLQYAWVARQIPHDRRCQALSFSHHREVADLDPDQQYVWLSRAEDAGYSSHRLRRELAKATKAESRLWVIVAVASPEDADALVARLVGEGRAAKVIER